MNPAEEHADLRARLPRTFEAFYARFPRLLPIQALAVAPILAGEHVLLIAPTAGGKTEAVLAPLLQRILDEDGRFVEGPAILYLVPTRALVNDLHRRLREPFARLGLSLGRKTADHPDPGREMPQCLITTPESLDSLLSRAAKRLLPVRAVVLDELHALDGRPRGDQCAVLCERLRRVAATRGVEPQILMLGATVDRPEEMAARYAGSARVLEDPMRRPMRARIADCPFGRDPGPLLSSLLEHGASKVLVFCNARAEVEWAVERCKGRPPFGTAAFAHHGSLSREERERVERAFDHARIAVCFATSTLELGLDIGHVDRVVLFGVPPDVPSLLQRVGRAGRRKGGVEFLALARSPGERLRFRHLKKAASSKRLLTDPPVYDPGTALQQAASLLFQNPAKAISPAHLLERLPSWQRSYWTEVRLEEALAHAGRWFRRLAPGHYLATEELEERFRRGNLHSNLSGEAEVEVLEELTGRRLGTVSPGVLDGPETRGEPEAVLLGGKARFLKRSGDGRLLAGGAHGGGGMSRFKARPAPPVPLALAQDLLAWMGLNPAAVHRIEGEDDTIFLHGLGTLRGFLLHRSAGEAVRPRPGQGVSFGLLLRRGHQDWPSVLSQPDRLRIHARDLIPALSRLLGFGPWFRLLPPDEREHAVLAALRPDELSTRLARAEILPCFDDRIRAAARSLLA